MKKILLLAVIVCLCAIIPSANFAEDRATIRLARTIYAMAGDESYDGKLAVGTVVMNRVESPWYPNDLEKVLSQKHQFPSGSRYDEESLRAAHAVLSGDRGLDADVIDLQAKDAASPRPDAPAAEKGNYNFYTTQWR